MEQQVPAEDILPQDGCENVDEIDDSGDISESSRNLCNSNVPEVKYAQDKSTYNKWQVVDECFELHHRYNIVDYLGAGAYGVVCSAFDKVANRMVAIKKCKKIFQSRTMAKRTLRELRILRLLDHENVSQPSFNSINKLCYSHVDCENIFCSSTSRSIKLY